MTSGWDRLQGTRRGSHVLSRTPSQLPRGERPLMLHGPERSWSPGHLFHFGRGWSRRCHPRHQPCARRPLPVIKKCLQVGCQVPGGQPSGSQDREELRPES